MFNFETIEELNLSQNWFGAQGLYNIKDEFLRFKKLKTLNLEFSKLCMGPP